MTDLPAGARWFIAIEDPERRAAIVLWAANEVADEKGRFTKDAAQAFLFDQTPELLQATLDQIPVPEDW